MLQREGIDATATPGVKGQFDVVADGEVVFSKASEHRFPDHDEVLAALDVSK